MSTTSTQVPRMGTRISRVDDIIGEALIDRDPIRFAVDDIEYEIDLSSTSHARLRAVLAPYIGASRRARYGTVALPKVEPKKRRFSAT
jgi:hypothetical protein